MTYERMGST